MIIPYKFIYSTHTSSVQMAHRQYFIHKFRNFVRCSIWEVFSLLLMYHGNIYIYICFILHLGVSILVRRRVAPSSSHMWVMSMYDTTMYSFTGYEGIFRVSALRCERHKLCACGLLAPKCATTWFACAIIISIRRCATLEKSLPNGHLICECAFSCVCVCLCLLKCVFYLLFCCLN